MKRIAYVSIILENMEGEVLLLLRENMSTHIFPNHWTLISGNIQNDETAEMAAHRKLKEETGLKTNLSLWKRYDREHPLLMIDQHIFVGKVDTSGGLLVLGGDTLFFNRSEIPYLKIGYGFKSLLNEYFLTTMDDLLVHHS